MSDDLAQLGYALEGGMLRAVMSIGRFPRLRRDSHLFEYANHRIHPSLRVDSFLFPATTIYSQGLHKHLKIDAERVLLVSLHV